MASSFGRISPAKSSLSAHRSFRLTRPAKEKMMGKAVGNYMPQQIKKELRGLEEQIVHAVGRGDKTFTDATGVEHKISDEMRYFAKEAQQGGHTLTRKSEVKKFAAGFVETAREEDIKLRSGYNIGTEREVAGKILKQEEAQLAPAEKISAQQQRRVHRGQLDAIRQRLGLGGDATAVSAGTTPTPAPAPTTQEIQPLSPGSAPAKPPAANRPIGLMNPGIIAGRRTNTDDRLDQPTIIAPSPDPLAEENQSVAESIPPAQPVDLPDTSNVDKGLPF